MSEIPTDFDRNFIGSKQSRHCDDYINDYSQANCLRWFLFVNRLSAIQINLCRANDVTPKLWAKYEGEWVRVTIASRFGDVGITKNLDSERKYESRACIDELSSFTDKRPSFNKSKVML